MKYSKMTLEVELLESLATIIFKAMNVGNISEYEPDLDLSFRNLINRMWQTVHSKTVDVSQMDPLNFEQAIDYTRLKLNKLNLDHTEKCVKLYKRVNELKSSKVYFKAKFIQILQYLKYL